MQAAFWYYSIRHIYLQNVTQEVLSAIRQKMRVQIRFPQTREARRRARVTVMFSRETGLEPPQRQQATKTKKEETFRSENFSEPPVG